MFGDDFSNMKCYASSESSNSSEIFDPGPESDPCMEDTIEITEAEFQQDYQQIYELLSPHIHDPLTAVPTISKTVHEATLKIEALENRRDIVKNILYARKRREQLVSDHSKALRALLETDVVKEIPELIRSINHYVISTTTTEDVAKFAQEPNAVDDHFNALINEMNEKVSRLNRKKTILQDSPVLHKLFRDIADANREFEGLKDETGKSIWFRFPYLFVPDKPGKAGRFY